MRQIVLEEPERFAEHSVAPPTRKPGEALVRIHRVGICGSDWHAFYGRQPNYTYPRVIGHELSCTVLEAPPNDRGISVGDRCAVEPHLTCGVCVPCRLNRPNCCESMQVLGVHVDGGMGGMMTVPVERLYKSEKLSLDELSLVETLTIGAHAVARSGLVAGEEALIVGAGPIGLSVLQFALTAGASAKVVEKVEFRRQFARRFGVEAVPETDPCTGFVVFDATGDKDAIQTSFDRVRTAGRLVLVGQFLGPVCFEHTPLIRREMNVIAVRNSHHQFPRVIGMIERGEINADPWIEHCGPISLVPKVFGDLAVRKDYIKAVFEVKDSDV